MAGIRVCMITGDHAATAVAIAKQIGLFRDNDRMLNGDALGGVSEEQLAAFDPFPVVRRERASLFLALSIAVHNVRAGLCSSAGVLACES